MMDNTSYRQSEGKTPRWDVQDTAGSLGPNSCKRLWSLCFDLNQVVWKIHTSPCNIHTECGNQAKETGAAKVKEKVNGCIHQCQGLLLPASVLYQRTIPYQPYDSGVGIATIMARTEPTESLKELRDSSMNHAMELQSSSVMLLHSTLVLHCTKGIRYS